MIKYEGSTKKLNENINRMEKKLKLIKKLGSIILSLTSIAFLASIINLYSETEIDRNIRKSINNNTPELFEYLTKGIKSNTFNEEFYKIAFNHYDRKYKGSFSKYGYTEILEDFVIFVSSKIDTTIIDTLYYNQAKNVLEIAKQTEPFSSLPSEERRLMDNIHFFIQENNIEHSITALNELKQVILARHREYERIEKLNYWTIPLAFGGIGATLIFGIVSTYRAFKKPVKKETEHISTT